MEINLKIIYEDNDIVVLDKPQGIPTTPGKNENNFCACVFNKYPDLKSVKGYKSDEGGLLNRLDNETGGLILFAKNNEAFKYYSKQMNDSKIKKIYHALVDGIPDKKEGVINIPIAHHYTDKKRMVCVDNINKYRGKPRLASTSWKLLKSNNNISLLEIFIFKGTRHQIRVHLAYIGLPILFDKLYNKNKFNNCQFHQLFSTGIEFFNIKNEKIFISAEIFMTL